MPRAKPENYSRSILRAMHKLKPKDAAETKEFVHTLLGLVAVYTFGMRGNPVFTEQKFAAAVEAGREAIADICDNFDERN